MKIALVTARPSVGKKKTNLDYIKKIVGDTSADLFIFGELFTTGYSLKDELRDHAETLQGKTIRSLKKIAAENKCYIVTGMPLYDETVKGLIYNASVLIHPDKKVDCYHKWFLPTLGPFEEKLFFDQGEEIPVFSTQFGTVGLLICYDIYFPELLKAYAYQGADLLICISASPNTTRKYFETLLPARAIENTVFMAYVNLVGAQENLVLWGGSQVYDPLGNLCVKAPYYKESVVTYDLDFSMISQVRANRPVLRDVRPELFHDLYEITRHHKRKNQS